MKKDDRFPLFGLDDSTDDGYGYVCTQVVRGDGTEEKRADIVPGAECRECNGYGVLHNGTNCPECSEEIENKE